MIGPGIDILTSSVSEREILDAVLLVLVFSLAIRDLIIMQLSRYRTTYIEIEGQVIRVKYRHMSGELWMDTKGLLAEVQARDEATEKDADRVPLEDSMSLEVRSSVMTLEAVAVCVSRMDSAARPENGGVPPDESYSPLVLETDSSTVTWNNASKDDRAKVLVDYQVIADLIWRQLIPQREEARLLGKSARQASTETQSSPPASTPSSSTPATSP